MKPEDTVPKDDLLALQRSTYPGEPASWSREGDEKRIQAAQSDDIADADAERLRKLGIFTPSTLAEAVKSEAKRAYLVEGLLRVRTVNLLVGDSGLGKTPFAIQLGICIAAGIPLFNLRVQKGPVLYCDAESGRPEFAETLGVISHFQGLCEPPPDFHIWSPNWEIDVPPHQTASMSRGLQLLDRVKEVRPSFVVVDALRTFWTEAETKNHAAAEMISSLRKVKGVTWLLLHHRRKVNQQASVVDLWENPHAWFQEAAGAHALVNQSDTRLGVVPASGQADLILGGFVRGIGAIAPMDLARASGEDGSPVGYRLLTGVDLLSPDDRAVYDKLPQQFRFRNARAAMGGTSDSNANRFLKKCGSLQIVKKNGPEYIKTLPGGGVGGVIGVLQDMRAPHAPLTPSDESTSRSDHE